MEHDLNEAIRQSVNGVFWLIMIALAVALVIEFRALIAELWYLVTGQRPTSGGDDQFGDGGSDGWTGTDTSEKDAGKPSAPSRTPAAPRPPANDIADWRSRR